MCIRKRLSPTSTIASRVAKSRKSRQRSFRTILRYSIKLWASDSSEQSPGPFHHWHINHQTIERCRSSAVALCLFKSGNNSARIIYFLNTRCERSVDDIHLLRMNSKLSLESTLLGFRNITPQSLFIAKREIRCIQRRHPACTGPNTHRLSGKPHL